MNKFTNHFFKNVTTFIIIFVLILIPGVQAKDSDYSNRLYTPTYITKISDIYFIVDCWNHRIIYSRDINKPIKNWSILDNNIAGPHSIAGNGTTFIAEDTGRNRLFVYTLTPKGFKKTQIIDNIDGRPHRTIYDPKTKAFYVLTSTTQNMIVLTEKNKKVDIIKKVNLKFLKETYTRSFSIIDDKMYFVSGPQKIIVTDYLKGNFEVEKEFIVPNNVSEMNDIKKIQDYFYISIYPESMIRIKDLTNFHNVENIYKKIGFKGTPYYINSFDGKYFITEIDSSSGVKSFRVTNNEIMDIKTINDSGSADEKVLKRKSEFPT